MRVFAGPNGSGKSTIIDSIRNLTIEGRVIDFGTYINADEIAKSLRHSTFTFDHYGIGIVKQSNVEEIAFQSGLLKDKLTSSAFFASMTLTENRVNLGKMDFVEQIAQIFADFIRYRLLLAKRKFSFETVFSHRSKIDLMRECSEAGYKVYLYFVGTESPAINLYRVKSRILKGGHHVPDEKIVSRYFASMNLLKEAAQFCYQCFFFDNSIDGKPHSLFAHFKVVEGRKVWSEIDWNQVPDWFYTYYKNS